MATVFITGANRGIGLELCRQLHERGDQVIGACRASSPELAALGVRTVAGLDVASDEDAGCLSETMGKTRIDLLLLNAGVLSHESLEDLNFDRMRYQFEVNSLGPLRVTKALLPNLGAGSKIAIITSRMGSIDDNTSGGRYGYRMSKAAVNMAGVSLACDLKPRQIAVGIIHPGFVRTDMTGHEGLIDPPESASGIIARIDQLDLHNTGGFWHENGEVLPW